MTDVYIDHSEIYLDFVNAHNAENNTALHIAIIEGSTECFNLLFRYGGLDLNVVDSEGATPLMLANKYRRTDMQKKLQKIDEMGISFLQLHETQFNEQLLIDVLKEPEEEATKRIHEKNQSFDILTTIQKNQEAIDQKKKMEE